MRNIWRAREYINREEVTVLDIQIDSREKARAITKIINEFERQGIGYYTSKLWVGDYMSLDNPRLIIDRKQTLAEVCGNLCQQHKRFKDGLVRAQERGIQMVILVEHSAHIKSIDDVEKWKNPRTRAWEKKIREQAGCGYDFPIEDAILLAKQYGFKVTAPPTPGPTLAKQMQTLSERYGVRWEFCSKQQTGKRIIEILRDGL